MQYEIKNKGKLLDLKGNLNEVGYSKKMVCEYDRKDIKVRKSRIKEWDYYLIYNNDYAVALTVADNGYMGMLSASVIRFKEKQEKTTSVMTFMPLGKFNMPATSTKGDVYFKNKRIEAKFNHIDGGRDLYFSMLNFDGEKALEVSFRLQNEPEESMVINTPFKKKKHFYYNQKIVGFSAQGNIKIGDEIIEFNNEDTKALLDWGRGVWTYKNTWYWGSAMGNVDGANIGFNIGYGFGNNTKSTENMLFYNGKAHKINEVKFEIPQKDGKDDFMGAWKFTSNDGRFEMDFEPIINRSANINALVLCSNQNQVFGKFTGFIILDDNKKIEIKDMLGFAEKVYNKW